MLSSQSIEVNLASLRLIPAHRESLLKLAVAFITLFFGVEGERNPASFITHQMILDLVISGKSWKTVLTNSNIDDGYIGGLAAMTMKDADVVKSSRRLQGVFQ